MNRNFFAFAGAVLLAAATGCAMCDSSQDHAFSAYGGKWQRSNPCSGRVGSVIDPAGAFVQSQPIADADAVPSIGDDEQSVMRADEEESADAPPALDDGQAADVAPVLEESPMTDDPPASSDDSDASEVPGFIQGLDLGSGADDSTAPRQSSPNGVDDLPLLQLPPGN